MSRAPKDADGRAKLYADIAHPINSFCREMIQDVVIDEYYEEIERAKQPGYVSRYDDFEFEYSDAPRSRPARFDQPHALAGGAAAYQRRKGAGRGGRCCRKPHFRRDPPSDVRGAPHAPPADGRRFRRRHFSE